MSRLGRSWPPRRAMLGVAFLLMLSACTLLNSLDGFSDGDARLEAGAPQPDGYVDGAAPLDGAGDETTSGGDGGSELAAYRLAVLADTPLAYWRFEETDLPIAKDELGKYDATYQLAPVLGAPGIKGGRAVRFPAGQETHITQEDPVFRFPGNVPYAVEMWVKPILFGTNRWLASSERTGSPRNGWGLFVNSSAEVAYEVWAPPLTDGGSSQRRGIYSSPAGALVAGRFQHVVVSYNGSVGSIWVDGVRRANNNAGNPSPELGALTLGCRRNGSTPFACLDDGVIDEVAIYDHTLSDTQIMNHYALGKP